MGSSLSKRGKKRVDINVEEESEKRDQEMSEEATMKRDEERMMSQEAPPDAPSQSGAETTAPPPPSLPTPTTQTQAMQTPPPPPPPKTKTPQQQPTTTTTTSSSSSSSSSSSTHAPGGVRSKRAKRDVVFNEVECFAGYLACKNKLIEPTPTPTPASSSTDASLSSQCLRVQRLVLCAGNLDVEKSTSLAGMAKSKRGQTVFAEFAQDRNEGRKRRDWWGEQAIPDNVIALCVLYPILLARC